MFEASQFLSARKNYSITFKKYYKKSQKVRPTVLKMLIEIFNDVPTRNPSLDRVKSRSTR